jgi:hypothetical protein
VAAGTPAKTPQGNAVAFDGGLYYTFSNPGLLSDWSLQFWLRRRGQHGHRWCVGGNPAGWNRVKPATAVE